MHGVTIRVRSDGITELKPTLPRRDASERYLVITTVLLVSGGLYLCGSMPPRVLATLVAACLGGEVVLAAKALLLLGRPAATVVEVPDVERRRVARRR